jgi:hypothetical protein
MLTIAWDVDDVLNELMASWLKDWKKVHTSVSIQYKDLTENPPHNILGISLAHYLSSLDDFRLSEFYQKMTPQGEVFRWFNSNGDRFRHIALSATPLTAAPTTAAWVLRHYGNWVRSFCFVPSFRHDQATTGYDRDKGEFLKWFQRADILVDDSPENIKSAANAGMAAFMIPRPWNCSKSSVHKVLEDLINFVA